MHYMNEELDRGFIIKKEMFDLQEPPRSKDELGSLTHWHMMKMFKDTIFALYYFSEPVNEVYIKQYLRRTEQPI